MDERLSSLFRTVMTNFQLRMEKLPAVEALGLPAYQARLFGAIGRRPGVSQQELATATGRDKAQVARAIAGLESRRLVHRSEHDTDWRAYGLSLTAEGRELWSLAEQQRKAVVGEAFAGLTVDEIEILTLLLERIISNLDSSTK